MEGDFYPLAGFKYHFRSIVFVLNYALLIESGKWPHQPSGYTNNPDLVQTSLRGGAKFTGPVEVIAEIKARLDMCGQDGKAAFFFHCYGIPLEEIADFLNWDEPMTLRRINCAISYCCGYKRRRESYRDYRRNRRSRYQKAGQVQSQICTK